MPCVYVLSFKCFILNFAMFFEYQFRTIHFFFEFYLMYSLRSTTLQVIVESESKKLLVSKCQKFLWKNIAYRLIQSSRMRCFFRATSDIQRQAFSTLIRPLFEELSYAKITWGRIRKKKNLLTSENTMKKHCKI